MAVNYDTTTKNDRLNVVRNRIDSGVGAGFIEICSASFAAVLATIALADPCAPDASGGVLTFTMPRSDTSADATGTAAVARIKESAGTTIVNNLTVGTSGTDIILNSTSITAGQQVTINSATITHAA